MGGGDDLRAVGAVLLEAEADGALAVAALQIVIEYEAALHVAAVGNGQKLALLRDGMAVNYAVARLELHAVDAARLTAGHGHGAELEAEAHAAP